MNAQDRKATGSLLPTRGLGGSCCPLGHRRPPETGGLLTLHIQRRAGAQLRGADGGVVRGMGAQETPRVSKVVVQLDVPLRARAGTSKTIRDECLAAA